MGTRRAASALTVGLGIVVVRAPSLKSAAIASPSPAGGRRKERWKEPYARAEKRMRNGIRLVGRARRASRH